MSFYLYSQGDGALNEFVNFTKFTIPSSEDFTIRVKGYCSFASNDAIVGETGAFNNSIVFLGGSSIRIELQGSGPLYFDFITPLNVDEVYDFEIQRAGGSTIDIVDTLTQSSIVTVTVSSSNQFALNSFFREGNGSHDYKGGLNLFQVTSSTVNHKWDADASYRTNTGSQPVLVDTVGSNDATGTGFPTDGSAWVDLGGGGGNDVILDVDNGAFSLSGSDVLFMASRIEQALTGNYNLSGSDIDFSIGYAINLDGGIYSLSGNATGLVLNANTVIESGEYSLAGTQANLDIARKSIIESGSYNLTGSDVTLVYTPGGVGESLFIDSGAFSLTGSDIGLKSTRLISVNSGSYNLTGQQISLTYNAKTIIDSGSYALIGSNVNLFANRVIIAVNGSYTLSGTSVILKYSGDTYKTIGTVTAGFAQDRYSAEYKPTTITVNFKD